ncbi:MAG TPA: endonuclease domain-containing protein [Bradyrhizobium sp.]|jgi:hypothetical protein|uniref:endonuclease domain-containing protein n=1 Tax=Bradyrhizobium sp. TaxID=376 RepID=UPI002C00CAB4|nr:endonuclease domain-containing protein [Bradyrhizobium sp.]HTA98913.1 endonuclease domain-containing protein [Bradyrhizobium sp.]
MTYISPRIPDLEAKFASLERDLPLIQTTSDGRLKIGRRKLEGEGETPAQRHRARKRESLPAPHVAGHCDLCERPAKLVWDHDHDLEELGFPPAETHRGWLCNGCNVRLGRVGDTPQAIKALIDRGDARPGLGRLLAYVRGQRPSE